MAATHQWPARHTRRKFTHLCGPPRPQFDEVNASEAGPSCQCSGPFERAALGLGERTAATGEEHVPPAGRATSGARCAPVSLSVVAWHPAADGWSSSSRRRLGHVLPPARRPIPCRGRLLKGSYSGLLPGQAQFQSRMRARRAGEIGTTPRRHRRAPRASALARQRAGKGPATSFAGRIGTRMLSAPRTRAAQPMACGRRGVVPISPEEAERRSPECRAWRIDGQRGHLTSN
jgi:hypothetical protein